MLRDQLLDRAAAALRGDDERAVLDERARVAEVVDVLARGALAGLAAARDGVGPRGVEPDGVALAHLREIGADGVEVDGGCGFVGGRRRRRLLR